MKTIRFAAVVLLCAFTLLQPMAWAVDYPDLIYFDGTPQNLQNGRKGTLKLEPQQMQFCLEAGDCLDIPYSEIQEISGQTLTKQRRMMGLAGPNPIMLGASLGVMALYNALSKGNGPSHYDCLVLLDPMGITHKVSILVPNEALQHEIMNGIARNRSLAAFQQKSARVASRIPQHYDAERVIPLPRPADDPGYGEYEQNLYSMLITAWQQNPVSAQPLQDDIQLIFSVDSNGQVQDAWAHQTSGNKNYDDAAIQTLRALGSLPALPDYYTETPVSYSVFLSPQSQPTDSMDDYVSDVKRKAMSLWRPAIMDGAAHIKAKFAIHSDGSLGQVNLIESSGNLAMDESVLQALRQSAPFAALPEQYSHGTVTLEMDFNYRFGTQARQ